MKKQLPTHSSQLTTHFRFQIEKYLSQGLKIFASSSFQTHSIPMLHILATIDRTIPVYFINTGFHFPETIHYKNSIARQLNIKVIDVESPITKIHQLDAYGRFFYSSEPDYCCHLNKVLPLAPVQAQYDVWITGVRKDQNSNRATFQYEVKGSNGVLRFHPMLEWTNKMIWDYRQEHQLPAHPLEEQGYLSVGCEPCTQRYSGEGRDGRWAGMKKTECGLHIKS